MAAARLFQRRPALPRIQGSYAMEILSSADWAFPGHAMPFQPSTFHEIGKEGVIAKSRATHWEGRTPKDGEITTGLSVPRLTGSCALRPTPIPAPSSIAMAGR